jgi:hypothetical protein
VSRELHPFLATLAEIGAYTPPEDTVRPRNGTAGHTPLPAPGDPQAARYAAAALADECAAVAHTDEGARNHTLNKAAFRMGQLVGNGYLDDRTAETELVDAGIAAGLDYTEADRTVQSGLTAGRAAPRPDIELRPHVAPAYTMPTPPEDTQDDTQPAAELPVLIEPVDPRTEALRRLIDGGTFIHQAPTQVPALWGEDDDVLWAHGEPLLLTGPTGVGKTTLGGMIIAGRMGLLPDVLGYPVHAGHQRTLVLAMDRPAQIQRAMARLLRAWPEETLNDRLVVWRGPPPADLARHPHTLLWLAQQAGADTVVLDSLKDAAIKLSDEETGQGISRAMNLCVTEGVEVLAYHHQTKRGAGGLGKPNSIADVYGSSWITAGAGSVLLLWGEAGDAIVELSHLKQPASEVGPLRVLHDHVAGQSTVYGGGDEVDQVLSLLAAGPQSAATVASWLYGETADHTDVVRARRRLDKLVRSGHAARLDPGARRGGARGGARGGSDGLRYALVSSQAVTIFAERSTNDFDVCAGQTTNGPFVEKVDERANVRRTATPVSAGQSTNVSTNGTNAASTNADTPPFKGGSAGRSSTTVPGVCDKCHQPVADTIPGTRGQRWCRDCAYPAPHGHTHDRDNED